MSGQLKLMVGSWVCASASIVVLAVPVMAQPRPLRTEDPESIGAGKIAVHMGVDYLRDQSFPVSGLRGHHTNVPNIGLRFGYGEAEFQVEHASRQHLRVTERFPAPLSADVTFDGDSTSDFEDLVVGAKVRILSETAKRPSIGFHLATRLPNANTRSGLGPNTLAFHNSVLIGKSFGLVRVVGNAGLGIFGDPTSGTRQNDVVLYGFSVSGNLPWSIQAVGEVNGYLNRRTRNVPPGTSTSGFGRTGIRYRRGALQFDGAVVFGLQDRDGTVGLTTGVTVIFPGFGG